jgi:hypothetical protein
MAGETIGFACKTNRRRIVAGTERWNSLPAFRTGDGRNASVEARIAAMEAARKAESRPPENDFAEVSPPAPGDGH